MIPHMIPNLIPQHDTVKHSIMKYPSLRFVIDRKHVATKKKRGLVQLEVLSEGKRKWIGTGVKLYSDQWSDRKKVINSSEMLQLNQRLDEMMRVIQDWVNDLIRKKEAFEFEKMDAFLKYFNHSENYIEFLERRINERNDITESTRKSHRVLISSLKEFGGITYISDLTVQNIKLYDNWLHGKYKSQPTIHNYHKRNKVYIHEAMSLGLLKDYPYTGVIVKRGKYKRRRFLYQEELDKIRIKTEEDYYIVLLSPALEVLKKYNYELPIISNTQYNLRLKLVADYAGLDKNLTTHMARHTFATLALTKGVQFKAVSKMLGHSSLKTTEEYAAILNKDVDKGYEMFEKQISG